MSLSCIYRTGHCGVSITWLALTEGRTVAGAAKAILPTGESHFCTFGGGRLRARVAHEGVPTPTEKWLHWRHPQNNPLCEAPPQGPRTTDKARQAGQAAE